jgi:hypothetical protein
MFTHDLKGDEKHPPDEIKPITLYPLLASLLYNQPYGKIYG